MKKEAWNIKQLRAKMDDDLAMCHSQFERTMVKAISGKEIRELAEKIATTRRLTPGEAAIAQEFGWQ
jgi:hypothetical protein